MDSKIDMEQKISILSKTDQGVSFIITGNANGDPWAAIFVAYNGDRKPKGFSLPRVSSVWRQVVNGQKAGVGVLAEIPGDTITLPSLSIAVLYDSEG